MELQLKELETIDDWKRQTSWAVQDGLRSEVTIFLSTARFF
jgi:hypothetical protein